MDEVVARIDARFDRVDARLERIELRLDRAGEQMISIQRQIAIGTRAIVLVLIAQLVAFLIVSA